eukprot:4263108-Prymnesium_polylepis.2
MLDSLTVTSPLARPAAVLKARHIEGAASGGGAAASSSVLGVHRLAIPDKIDMCSGFLFAWRRAAFSGARLATALLLLVRRIKTLLAGRGLLVALLLLSKSHGRSGLL